MRTQVLILVLSCFAGLLQAQYDLIGSPIISHFQKSDYNAGTQNWAVVQDSRGIMYFGNNKGLLEFDGTTWRIYPLPNATIVRSLAFGDEGRLYIGGQDELGYMVSDEVGNSTYISLVDLIPDAFRSFEDIWRIVPKEDKIFFYSHRAIFILEGKQMQVVKPASQFVNFFECGSDIYLQNPEEGLLIWKEDKFQVIKDGTQFANMGIATILPYKNGQCLIFTVSEGVFLMNASDIRPWKIEATDFLITNNVYTGIRLSDDNFAIGTTENGLLIIDQNGHPLMHLNQQTGLQNNTVLNVSQDKHQNLWLGLDIGIDYVESSAPFSRVSEEVGVPGTGYASFIYNNKLYLGTNQGLFSINWPKSENPFKPSKFEKVESIKGQVWNINKLNGDLLVSQHEGAVQLKKGLVSPLSEIKGAWKFLQLQKHPEFAVAGSYLGLYLYERRFTSDPAAADWKYLRKLEGFDESARILEQDADGNIWVSHAYKGLYRIRLDIENKRIAEVSLYNSEHGLSSDLYINVSKIRDELVFTTPNGVCRYDSKTDRFLEHKEFNELFGANANVRRLIEDQLGNVWFYVNDEFGLLKIIEQGISNKKEKIYFNQLQENIMDGFEHVFAYDNQNIFIATEKGFIRYNPSSNKNFQLPFETLIRKVTIIGEKDSIVFGGNPPGEFLPASLNSNQLFHCKFNDFSFSFSSPFFEQINHIQYRYRLEGFQENWSEWTTQTEKEYTNLNQGMYAFEVEARNAYAQTSDSAIFSFTIQPPWYGTSLAKIGYLLALIVVVAGFLKHFSKKSEKQKAFLKQEQAKKLQQKDDEFKEEVKKSEAEIIKLRNEKLEAELNHKNSQMASTALHLVQKEEMLHKLKLELNKLVLKADPKNKRQIKGLIRSITEDMNLDGNWEQFEFHFDKIHENFLRRLREKHPVLTPKDQKLCAYLRMNLSTKEIAPLMNISVRGVEVGRYRLRKKLGIDSDTNLIDFMLKV
ncbi:MAG: hypothetical protein GY705_23355 [Bacteroidetes bacterium]|nr:hypothetical protein [Bacteroidota bacterium]